MSEKSCHVAVIIVGFGNPMEVQDCLSALALAAPNPSFDIFICENGGKEAFQELNNILTTAQGPCNTYTGNREIPRNSYLDNFAEVRCLTLKGRSTLVWTACATHNLGYAGAINGWINRLRTFSDWDGVWILNPDTKPYPDALANLVQRAVTGSKGMISSTLVPDDAHDRVHNRALRWDKFRARTVGMGSGDSVHAPYDLIAIEAAMDSPSGASMYVTRTCIEHIGLMDERFFLYFEDIDWGMRARKCGLGYAGSSIVPHKGGTTIGKLSAHRRDRSKLAVYLESRNRILFSKKHFPARSAFVSLISVAYAFLYLWAGSPSNFKVALKGIIAGWTDETGPPSDPYYTGYLRAIFSKVPAAFNRKLKLTTSLVYYCAQVVWRATLSVMGRSPVPRLVILYYHGVENNYRFEFGRQMDMLARSANVVPADFQGTLSSKKINVAITFDDAFQSLVFNALPELASRCFHSTVFVPVGLIGRTPNWFTDVGFMNLQEVVMTADQIKTLSPTLVSIGSHGVQHLHLSRIDRNQAKDEIEKSRDELKDLIGRDVELFAFPYGDYDGQVTEICKSAGYKYAYSTTGESVDVLKSDYVRARVKVDPSDSQMEFFLKIHGSYDWLLKIKSIMF